MMVSTVKIDGVRRGEDSWAVAAFHPYAKHAELKFFNGYADLRPKNGTVQWHVNEALKGRSVAWEFEIAKAQVINAEKSGSDRANERRFLEIVPRYDDGGNQFSLKIPATRLSTLRVEIPKGESFQPSLLAGDRVLAEGTIGDYRAHPGIELNELHGPIVVYSGTNKPTFLQTTISIGLQNAKVTTKLTGPTYRFRHRASVPTKNRDDFLHARVAVSFDQQAVISRNYLIARGKNDLNRIGAHLGSLDPDNPKRTRLPDSTTFGFVPDSNLAYQVHWGSGVRFWDTRTHETSGEFIPHELREDTTMGPAVSPSGNVMVTRSQLDHLQFWDIETREPITKEIKQAGNVYSMRFSSNGKWFFSRAGGKLTIWEPKTGTLVAGGLRQDIYSFAYLSSTNQMVTVEAEKKGEAGWRSELVIRAGDRFAESRRIQLSARAIQAKWIDETHLLVIGDNDTWPTEPSDGKDFLYLVSLADKPEIQTLIRHAWIRDIEISPNGKHFIVRTRDETSCWQLGKQEPNWTQPGEHSVSFGDANWVLLHNGPLIAYSPSDGRELWRTEHIAMFQVSGSNIWTCNANEMVVWQVEDETDKPVKLR